MLYSILRLLGIFLFKILFRFKVYGKGNLLKKEGFILASNHVSFLDPIALGVASGRRLFFLARDDLFRPSWFSWLISTLGAFPLKKGGLDVGVMKRAISKLHQGKVLVVFPEGRRSIDGSLGKAHSGLGFLALHANAKVTPAFIKGTELALPRGAKFIRPAQIAVHFGKPLKPKEINLQTKDEKSYQKIANMTMQEIAALKSKYESQFS